MKKKKETELYTCDECLKEFPEGDVIKRYVCGDTVCVTCMEEMFPDHITKPEGSLQDKSISYYDVGPSMIVAHDTISGIAAVGTSKAAAKELLSAICGTVQHYENNERYGSIME